MKRSAGPLAVLLLALVAAGCGPTHSTSLIMEADVQLEAARAADAAKLAPYEFTAAEAYLRKAREEQGYADFDVAIDFGKKAVKFATDAKKKSMAARAEGALPTVPSLPAAPPPPAIKVEPVKAVEPATPPPPPPAAP